MWRWMSVCITLISRGYVMRTPPCNLDLSCPSTESQLDKDYKSRLFVLARLLSVWIVRLVVNCTQPFHHVWNWCVSSKEDSDVLSTVGGFSISDSGASPDRYSYLLFTCPIHHVGTCIVMLNACMIFQTSRNAYKQQEIHYTFEMEYLMCCMLILP